MTRTLLAIALCCLCGSAWAQLVVYRTVDKGMFNAEDGAVEPNRSDKGFMIVDLGNNLVTRLYYWGKGDERFYAVIPNSPLGKQIAQLNGKVTMYLANLHQDGNDDFGWADMDLVCGPMAAALKEPPIEAPKSFKGVRIELGGAAGALEEAISEVGYYQVTARLDAKLTKLFNATPRSMDEMIQFLLDEYLDAYLPEPHGD